MIMTIDVGNTTITGGIFDGEKLALKFRRSTNSAFSSDELGIFFRDVLDLNGFSARDVSQIACCSVVPALTHSLSNCFKKYFGHEAFFIQAGVKTGLKLKYSNPKEIGADRIAVAIGAAQAKSGTNLIVVDMGTATTVDVITQDKEYLGGAIMPGIGMSALSLATGTAQLPSVEIVRPKKPCGSSTIEAIQAGIFFGHAGAIKELCRQYQKNVFHGENTYVIGTGGFSNLYADYGIFDEIQRDLVLQGLLAALQLNDKES